MITIDSKFFQDVRVRALNAEFGPAGVYALIHIMCQIFESPEGYWMKWDLATRTVYAAECRMELKAFDEMIERMGSYGLVNHDRVKHQQVMTSNFIQREFVRQCGASRACKVRWDQCVDLSPDEMVELGVTPPEEEEEGTDEVVAIGEFRELPDRVSPELRAIYQRQRVKGRKKDKTAYYRLVKRRSECSVKEKYF